KNEQCAKMIWPEILLIEAYGFVKILERCVVVMLEIIDIPAADVRGSHVRLLFERLLKHLLCLLGVASMGQEIRLDGKNLGRSHVPDRIGRFCDGSLRFVALKLEVGLSSVGIQGHLHVL